MRRLIQLKVVRTVFLLLIVQSLFVVWHQPSTLALSSEIEDCCCNTETLDDTNEYLNDLLTKLRNQLYFRIFQVDLSKDCNLWHDAGICMKETCSIEECCPEEIPQTWRLADDERLQNNGVMSANPMKRDGVDRMISDIEFSEWRDNDEWQWVEPHRIGESVYVDLQKNPDGYTGYKGPEAGRVWKAIYEAKSAFNATNQTMEDRVLYKLISGFHTLTSAMVFANYPLDEMNGNNNNNNKNNPSSNGIGLMMGQSDAPDKPQFGPNPELYARFLRPNKQFIVNLYFDMVFLLRALNKARSVIEHWDFSTQSDSDGNSGLSESDEETRKLMFELINSNFVTHQCSAEGSFDESRMFADELVKNDFKRVFRNISTVLDCVGCEKCKLHAKLQFLGLGTALKILFTKGDLTAECLERNELISLIVTLGKFSDAIKFVNDMEELLGPETEEVSDSTVSSNDTTTKDKKQDL